MSLAARAGWLLSAALFATILSSILHVDHVGPAAPILLLLVALCAAVRPELGVLVIVAATPVAWHLSTQLWNWAVAWPETIVCAALAGLSLDAARQRDGESRLPRVVTGAAIVFGAIVVASLIASLGLKSLRLGPGFTGALVTQLTREYFIDVRGFPALHAGMLLLEGLLLFAAAARIAARPAGDLFLPRVVAAATVSATLAALFNLARLVGAAWRGQFFWASLFDLSDRLRWNVHYADFNAAGSYFVMAALLAAALAVRANGARRAAWIVCGIAIAVALWLTSSRVALLAGAVAPAAVCMCRELARGRARATRAAALAVAGLVVLIVIAVALPQRGSQKSSWLATDVRLGLMQTGARMIGSHPLFGIGLGGFYQRSGEFSTPELIAKFPVAVHENAHNNFLQVAAELGVAAGVLFAWVIAGSLLVIAMRAFTADDPFRLVVLAAVAAFALTCIGGHPLLIPEPGYAFWTILGVATGSAAIAGAPARRGVRWIVPLCLVAIALTLPWRLRASAQEADLEHEGIGVSATWQLSPDGIRYREAHGHATLFVPTGAAKFSVYPIADQPLRLELRLDGRVADIVTLAPRRWNDLTLPARTTASQARYGALDLRVVDADKTAFWVTKIQPFQ